MSRVKHEAVSLSLLDELEARAKQLEPPKEELAALTQQTVDFVLDFVENRCEGGPASYYDTEGAAVSSDEWAIPDDEDTTATATASRKKKSYDEILKLLGKDVLGEGLNSAGGSYMAYVAGGGVYHASLGDYIAAATNRFAGMYFACPGAVRMENMLIRWTAQHVLGINPKDANGAAALKRVRGTLVSGASIATLSAFVTARDDHRILSGGVHFYEWREAMQKKSGEQKDQPVFVDSAKFTVYSTNEVHSCIRKALWLCGAVEVTIRTVPKDPLNFRMDVAALRKMLQDDVAADFSPWLVVASAGSVNSGIVDPMQEIALVAREHNLWMHVDAAYGGMLALCDEGKAALRGIGQADSVVCDPHKSLFLPLGTGLLMVRHGEKLVQSHSVAASYLTKFVSDAEDEASPTDVSPELSRHFRALRMWLPLQLLGAEPFRAAQREKIYLARYCHDKLQGVPGLVMGPYPELTLLTYRIGSKGEEAPSSQGREEEEECAIRNAETELLVQRINEPRVVFVSPTTIDGVFWGRCCINCFRTHRNLVDAFVARVSTCTADIIAARK